MYCSTVFLFLAILSPFCHADIFTNIEGMPSLIEVESVMINKLETYIAAQEMKLVKMEKILSACKLENAIAADNPYEYVTNPIRAFLLLKRLTEDWKKIEKEILADPSMEAIRNIVADHNALKFPHDEDLQGAAVALVRLQDTYKMDTASIAEGKLRDVQHSAKLTANDCFELGVHMYTRNDFNHAALWFVESLAHYESETEKTIPKIDILDHLSYSLYKLGDNQNASKHFSELLAIDPEHRPDRKLSLISSSAENTREERVVTELETVDENYAELCRGDGKLPAEIASRLACRYVDHNIPFLKIAPLKEEEAFLDPRIVVYHDVIFDSEIETIKELVTPKLTRSGAGSEKISANRISKHGWLKDLDHRHVDAVSQRSSDMSGGLSRETVENLQVANYGIGGHYIAHHDFELASRLFDDQNVNGNRIASVLFYMSDVDQGGATVFPELGVTVFPKKGSALLWWNMYLDGEVDFRTLHAACPVLSGSKWVGTKWYGERAQEFIHSCGMKKDSPEPV